MKAVRINTSRIRPIAYLSNLVKLRRVRGTGRSLSLQAEKLGFKRTSKGPQNVDQAFQSFLLDERIK